MTGLAKNLDISEAIWGLLSSRKYLLPSVFFVSAVLFPNGSFAGNFDGLPDGGKVDYGNVIIKKNNNLIISLGGGTPCYFDNIDFLNSFDETKTFFLQASISTILNRLNHSKVRRPLISHLRTELEIKEFVGKHLLERNHFYERSEKKINTNDKTISDVANEIIKSLG